MPIHNALHRSSLASGPGGGTVASELACANFSVLLLEAGDDSLPRCIGDYRPGLAWDFFVKQYEELERNMKNNHVTWLTKEGRYWVGKGDENPPDGITREVARLVARA